MKYKITIQLPKKKVENKIIFYFYLINSYKSNKKIWTTRKMRLYIYFLPCIFSLIKNLLLFIIHIERFETIWNDSTDPKSEECLQKGEDGERWKMRGRESRNVTPQRALCNLSCHAATFHNTGIVFNILTIYMAAYMHSRSVSRYLRALVRESRVKGNNLAN